MKRTVEIGGEWFPIKKILGRDPSDTELERIMALEEELSNGAPLVIKAPKKAHNLIGRNNRLFVSRRGSELCMRRPDGHTWYTEQVASDRKAARDRAHFVPSWRRRVPTLEMSDSTPVIDNTQDTYRQCDQRKRVKPRISEPAIYNGILVTCITPTRLLAFLESYPPVYTRYIEQQGFIEPVCPLSGQVAAKEGARVLRLSEVNPRLLDISEPI